MFKVYNTGALSNKQRFNRAIIVGFIAMILCIVVYVGIVSLIHVKSSLLFLAMGYVIGWVIQNYGHGVQPKFSILAAVYTILAIFLSEAIFYYLNVGLSLNEAFIWVLQGYLDVSLNSLLGLMLRVAGVMSAYQTSRIV